MLSVALALAVLAPGQAQPRREPDATDVGMHELPIVLDGPVRGLKEELSLRLPGRTISTFGAPQDAPLAFLWVGTEAGTDGAFTLRVIVSDGRLYQRTVLQPPQGERARVLAGAVANLVEGIERQEVAPTQTSVPIPQPEPEPTLETPEPEPDPEPEPEPEPEPQTPPDTPLPEPSGALHLTVGGGLVGGLVGAAPSIAGASGAIAVAWAARTGLVLGGEVRGSGWSADGLSVGRLRLWPRAGYAFAPARGWSLQIVAGPFVEPLWLSAPVRAPAGGVRSGAPLLGGAVAAGPAVRVWQRPRGPSIWVGLDLEVSGSAEIQRSPGVLIVRDAAGEGVVARAGGVELAGMLGVQLRLPRD